MTQKRASKKKTSGAAQRPPKAAARPPAKHPSKHPVGPAKIEAVQTVFRKSAALVEEMLSDLARLREQKLEVEKENQKLRTHLAKNSAMKDLLDKIRDLEREKSLLLSHVHEAEAASTRYSTRYGEMEEELSKLANVYIASYQLHSTLRLPRVVKHLKELLQQLVGARAYGIYWADSGKHLHLIASENIDVKKHARLAPGADDPASPVIERAFLTGVPTIAEGGLARRANKDAEGKDERRYLAPLAALVAARKTPADVLLERAGDDVKRVVEAAELTPVNPRS